MFLGDKLYVHNTELASNRFYAEVKNAIDELDTLDENTSIQCIFIVYL